MITPASITAIPFCKEPGDYKYDTDDPLLDYCEDYAWDPPDWDLETEESSGHWDLSEKNEYPTTNNQDTTIKYIPPKPSGVSPLLQAGTTSGPPRETHTAPHHVELDMSMMQVKGADGVRQGNNRGFGTLNYELLRKYYNAIKKASRMEIKSMKWIFFKWLFVVLNIVIEVCQAIFSEENALGKISTPFYLKMNIMTSAFCLMIAVIETIHEGTKRKVVWRKKGYLGWFYYPGRQRRLFGRFSLFFGVVSSMIQLCINLVALVINYNFLKFDLLPLLLSCAYLIAAMLEFDCGGKHMPKRKVRGRGPKQCSCGGVVVANPQSRSGLIQINLGDEPLGLDSNGLGPYSSLLSIKLL